MSDLMSDAAEAPMPSMLNSADVARLARVQRPVVSTWRRRYAYDRDPFPAPVAWSGSSPLFSSKEVAAWLERTRRGNNPNAGGDVASSVPLPVGDDAFTTATALLALAALGHPVAETRRELTTVAFAADTEDAMLRREIESIDEAHLATAVRDAASRIEASWGADVALEGLVRARPRSAPAMLNVGALVPRGVLLLSGLIRALAAETEASVIDDSTGYLDDIALELASGQDALQVAVSADHPVARLTRRRLAARGADADPPGGDDIAPSPLITWRMPPVEFNEESLLSVLTQAVVDQPPERTVIVIGPASVLLDRLRDSAAQSRRTDLVRDPRLRCALRLPRGLITSSPRQHLAVLMFSKRCAVGGADPERADVVYTADLDGVDVTPGTSERLIDDVVASLSPAGPRAAHEFAYGSWVRRGTLAARLSSLMPAAEAAARPSLRRPSREAAAESALAVAQLARSVGPSAADALSGLEPSSLYSPRPRTLLADLADRGVLRMYPGARIDASDVTEAGVAVISGDDVRRGGAETARAVPVLVQQAAYGRAMLTKPGDVVVVSGPPAAWIDRLGRSLVEAPARILRLVDGDRVGLAPELLAGAINSADETGADWRRWAVSSAPPSERVQVGAALEALHEHRLELRRRLDHLESAQRMLTDGVRDRTLYFSRTTPDTHLEGGA